MADMRVGTKVIGGDGIARNVVSTNDAGICATYRFHFRMEPVPTLAGITFGM